MRLTFKQLSIQWNAFAWFDHDVVTHQDFAHRNIHFPFVAEPVRLVRSQGMKGANGFSGLSFGTRFQPFAEHDQGVAGDLLLFAL